MTLVNLLSDLDALKKESKINLIKSLKSGLESTRIKEFKEGEERPCHEGDFKTEKKDIEISVLTLKLIITDLVDTNYFILEDSKNNVPDIDTELLALLLIICGENATVKPWNTKTSVQSCSEILKKILQLFECKNVSELIIKDCKRNLVKKFLQIIRLSLLASNWKHFPAAVACYCWMLENMKQPLLSPHLNVILPTALLLVDDFISENRIFGIKCLHHIVENVTVAELQFCGHGDVIYSSLIPLLRIREAELLCSLIPCLTTLTTKLEIDFGTKDITKWSKFDNVLEIFLENMEMEQQLDLRNAYITNLKLLINASGLGIIRWGKKLIRIFREYFEIGVKYEGERITNYCLKVVESFIKLTEPAMHLYNRKLFFILLVPLHSTLHSESEVQLESQEIVTGLLLKIFDSFSESDRRNIKEHLQKILESNNFNGFYQLIQPLLSK